MSRLNRFAVAAAVGVLMVCGAGVMMGAVMKDYLEGAWLVKVMPDEESRGNKARDIDDEWTFKGYQFTSTHFAKLGFASTPYDDDTRGVSSVTFKTAPQSEKEGVLLIEGMTSTGTELRGTIKWKKANGDEWNYTFQGEKKPLR